MTTKETKPGANFAEVFIRRPVMATMLVVFVVVLGMFSYRSLGIDLFPNVDLPVVTVVTTLRGASPEAMEAQVTKPIEEAINTASGIDELRSTTLEGMSIVVVTFLLERKTPEAVQDVRDKVGSVLARLPEGTDPPVITRLDTDAIPVATLVVSGRASMKALTELADRKIREDLQTIGGVGQVSLVGGQKRAINVWLDASKLVAHHLSIQQVKTALVAQNVEVPTGRVTRENSELMLRTMARVDEVDGFRELVVATVDGVPITLGELGRVEDGTEEPRSLARWDGENAVALVVQKQSGTNTVEVVDRVKGALTAMSDRLPVGVKVEIVRDGSTFIRRSIEEVKVHLVLGALLASLVVLLFMGNLRSTVIAAVAIPTSLIGTFTAMRALGFTLNNLTLLGLVLAVGIVIDDAIVVLENIYRHIEELGKPPLRAAIDGTREIMLAVVATTTSLIVIFLPIAFMAGRVGRFFNSFGITVAVAIAISLLIAVTFTPVLSSRWLRVARHPTKVDTDQAGGTWLNRLLHRGYGAAVRFSMRHKLVVIVASVAAVATVPLLFSRVGKDFLPLDDRNEFMVTVQTAPGSKLVESDRVMQTLEARIRQLPHVVHLLTTIGGTSLGGNEDVSQCSLYVGMRPVGERTDGVTQFAVMSMARKILAEYPGLRTSVQPINDLGGGGAQAYQFNFAIQGPDIDKLESIAQALIAKARRVPGMVDVDTASAERKPELRAYIDRRKAADLRVRAADIASSLRTLVGGEPVSKFREADEEYDVWLRLKESDRVGEAELYRLEVPSQPSGLIPLANLVEFRSDVGPAQIDRLDRQRQITIVANLDHLPLGTALEKLQEFAREEGLPPGYRTQSLGRAKVFAETGKNFAIAFGLSLIFMYMILAAQFESFLHPVTILLSLPLSIPFALASLLLLGETLNLYSVIGIFMLFGIVKKNGILQVDYTNTLRAQGMERDRAIYEANLVRLRPILMTTVTLIAGMTPIALGQGPGASSRASMAKVIVGGQALSLFITLLIVPVAYALFDDATVFLGRTLPSAVRDGRAWAYAIYGGGAALAAWLAVEFAGFFGELPTWMALVGRGLGAAGALAFFVGIALSRFDARRQVEAS